MKTIYDDGYHARDHLELEAVRAAVSILNASETVGVWEESANLHSADAMRKEMAISLHLPSVEKWEPDPEAMPSRFPNSGPGDEVGVCDVCGREVRRV